MESDFVCVHGLHGGQDTTESIGYIVDRTSWSLYGLHGGQDTWSQILHESMGFMVGRTSGVRFRLSPRAPRQAGHC